MRNIFCIGIINYNIQYGGSLSSGETLNCSITVLNNENVREKFTVYSNDAEGLSGTVKIENAQLWWPYLMNDVSGYMYTLEVFNLKIHFAMNVRLLWVSIDFVGLKYLFRLFFYWNDLKSTNITQEGADWVLGEFFEICNAFSRVF